jgi:hypothetical protein
MTLRRITRDRRLSQDEASKYREVRERVDEELPEMLVRHHERLATFEELEGLLKQLKAAQEEKG